MTSHPHIVKSYDQFNNCLPFEPITLGCAVPTDSSTPLNDKLTAVVTYFTPYCDTSDRPLFLSFGLGESVTVNAIIGLPTIIAWGLVVDPFTKRCYSHSMHKWFDLVFKNASTGLPANVTFTSADFVQPTRPGSTVSSNHITSVTK